MRIAYFSPLPPQQSGIADYSLELIPHLAQLAELTLFVPDPDLLDDQLLNQYEMSDYAGFVAQRDDFDLALYHAGNSEFHDEISRMALDFPGVVVLHDFDLRHAVAKRTIGAGHTFAYARELGYEQGAAGVRRALAPVHQPVHPHHRGSGAPFVQSPLNGRLLDASLGVIVHSRYTANLVRRQGYKGPLAIIPAPIAPIPGRSRRSDLNLPEDTVLYGSFGLVTKEKQVEMILSALRRLRGEMPQAHYLLVGGAMHDVPVKEVVNDLNLKDVVHVTGHVPKLADFVDWIYTADVVLNLRNPTVGETSAAALRAMAAGKPLIVNDHGWYSEIPSEAAIKLKPGDEDALVESMRLTGQSRSFRERMGEAGLRFSEDLFRPDKVAAVYIQELERIYNTVEIYG